MKLATCGHSCVRLSDARGTLVVDPGTLSDPAALDGAEAVLVTHEHADHLDAAALARALGGDRPPEVWGPRPVLAALAAAGATDAHLHEAAPGTAFVAAGHEVLPVGDGRHEIVHPDLPVVVDVGYLVDGAVLHPGDRYTTLPGVTVDVLLAPVGGPWVRIRDAADYVRAVAPAKVVPVHDAHLSDAGRGLVLSLLGPQALGAGHAYVLVDLPAGRTLDVDPRPEVHAALVADGLLRQHPEFAEPALLEDDETVPPRPEEEAADRSRA